MFDFYPRDAMLARVLAVPCVRLSVSVSVTSRSSVEMAERIELVFGMETFLPLILHCVCRKFGYLQK